MELDIAEITGSASINLRSQKILLSTLMDLPVLRCTTGICHDHGGRFVLLIPEYLKPFHNRKCIISYSVKDCCECEISN